MTTDAEEIVEFNSAMTAFETKQFSTAAQLLLHLQRKVMLMHSTVVRLCFKMVLVLHQTKIELLNI